MANRALPEANVCFCFGQKLRTGGKKEEGRDGEVK